MRTCPRCDLTYPDTAVWCDCGYDFRSGRMREQLTSGTSEGAMGPKGIGGWLIVFAISLSAAPILWLVAVFSDVDTLRQVTPVFKPDHPYYSPWWVPLVFGEVLYSLAGLVASCWLLVPFFGKKAKFPRSWVRVNVLLAILVTLDAIAVLLMWQHFPDVWKLEEVATQFRLVLYTWIGVCIWSRYLAKSRRVRNTFVQ